MAVAARSICLGLALAAAGLAARPAAAHPHVWIVTREAIEFDGEGRLRAVRHDWTFDEAYSAFAVQGLETGPDGRPKADKLAELAKVNVESLSEFDYFTAGKANGAKLAFAAPVDPSVTFDNGQLTLRFRLPVKVPAAIGRSLSMEVYDPTFFVDFALGDGPDAVRLVDPPAGCELRVNRPKPPDPARTNDLSESFFSGLGAASNFGAQFSNRILVACR